MIAPTRTTWQTWRRRLGRLVLGSMVVGLVATVLIIASGWRAFGTRASGARRVRMEASPQYRDGIFVNPQPLWNDILGASTSLLSPSPVASAHEGDVAVLFGDGSQFNTPPPSGLRVTWLGHSTLLLEIDGLRILTDPLFGERASPFTWVGPKRWYPPPIALDNMPAVDAVVISHDHHDHLQYSTIERIKDWNTTFIVPIGVGAHLAYWGVPPEHIVELDWWQPTRLTGTSGAGVDVVCTPARHASGRHLLDQNHTLWAGYAVVGPAHRLFFSGDTGLFPAMTEIGERFGPFDVSMIETGAYNPAWPDWHIGPEQAVRAAGMLRSKLMLPIHWGLWSLAPHGWTEPAERVLVEAERRHMPIVVPRPGQSIEPSQPPPVVRWWPSLPWQTGAQNPIVSRLVDPEPLPPALTP
jgi:L-ascorbate metabolism protein UlaG (beta-lactamase superfamily)